MATSEGLLTRLYTYNALHRNYPWYLAESIDKIGGAVLCMTAIWLLRRNGLRGILNELALSAPILPGDRFRVRLLGADVGRLHRHPVLLAQQHAAYAAIPHLV